MKIIIKAILSPFKFILTVLFVCTRRRPKRERTYKAFRDISGTKHFFEWQWKLLDKMFKHN